MSSAGSTGPTRRLVVDGSKTRASKCHVGGGRGRGVVDGAKIVVRRGRVVDGDKVGRVGVRGGVGGPRLVDVSVCLGTVRIILPMNVY